MRLDNHYSEKYIELARARNLTLQVGTKNGQKNGLELLVDVESFEYSYYPRGGRGFIIGLSDLGERNIIRQEGCFLDFCLQEKIRYFQDFMLSRERSPWLPCQYLAPRPRRPLFLSSKTRNFASQRTTFSRSTTTW